jgi:hypothetical protein
MKWLGSLPLLEVLFLERTGTRIRGELDLDLDSSSKRTTQIATPHLRVLSIKENVLTTNPLLEALPSPSQSLGVAIIGNINDDNDLIFPLALTATPTGLPESVFTHVQRFWQEKIGQNSPPPYVMPSGQLILHCGQMPQYKRIQFGIPPNAANTAPSVFYDFSFLIYDPDPALTTVDTMHISLLHDDDDDERYLSDEYHGVEEDAEGDKYALTPTLISLDQCFPSIHHVVVEYAGRTLYAVLELEAWLIERKSYTDVLETLRFAGRLDEGEEAWARELEQRGLVGRVMWSRFN